MRRNLLICLICFASVIYANYASACANYGSAEALYVGATGYDSNPGTIDRPFASIQYALRKLKAGDTLYIRAGTYAQAFSDEVLVKGTESQPITITSYPGEKPVIASIILEAGSQYVKITRLTFDGSLSTNPDCIKIENNDTGTSHHIEISYNEVKNARMQGMLIGGEDYTVIANHIHSSGSHRAGGHGIYCWGRRWTISNNVITDNAAFGIQCWPALADSIISHNTIVANGSSGIALCSKMPEADYYGSAMPAISSNNLFVNNIFAYHTNTVWSYQAGCAIFTYWGSETGSNNIMRNNIAYGNVSGDLTCRGGFSGITVEVDNIVADPLFKTKGPDAPDVTSTAGPDGSGYYVIDIPPRNRDALRDLHLLPSSPAIDAATNISVVSDKDGTSRPQGAGYDIGAYEYTGATPPDTILWSVSITSPSSGSTVSGLVTISANASASTGVVGIQFQLDGEDIEAEDITSPYSITWNAATASNGSHTLTAVARDTLGNRVASPSITVIVAPVTSIIPN